jgi:hypothetical protein
VSRFWFQSYSIFKNPSLFHNSSLKTVMSSSTTQDGNSKGAEEDVRETTNVEGEGKSSSEGKSKDEDQSEPTKAKRKKGTDCGGDHKGRFKSQVEMHKYLEGEFSDEEWKEFEKSRKEYNKSYNIQ